MNIRKIVQFSLGPIIAAILALVSMPLLTWIFPVEDIGRLAIFQVLLGVAVSILSLAMHQAYVREYYEVENRAALLKAVVAPGLFFTLIMMVGAIFICYLADVSISFFLFDIDSMVLTACVLAAVVANFFINFASHVIRMNEMALAFSVIQVAPKLMSLLVVFAIYCVGVGLNSEGLIFAYTMATLLTFVASAWMIRSELLEALYERLNIALMNKLLMFSLPLIAGGVAYWGLTTIDRFFLTELAGLEELGLYSVGATLASSVTLLSVLFSNLWHPVLYRWVRDGVDELNIIHIMKCMFLAVIFIWSSFGMLAPVIPSFFPDEYHAVGYMTLNLISLPLLYTFSQVTGVGIGIERKSVLSMLASVTALLVNVLLNIRLIPEFGAAGACIATSISFLVFFIVRTELSVGVWKGFPRFGFYSYMVLYVAASAYVLLGEVKSFWYLLFWISLMLIAFLQHRKTVSKLFQQFLKGNG